MGWRTAAAMPTQLPLDALEMALWVRGRAGQDVTGVIHHSDAGSQYTAIRYRSRLDDVGALASIGTVGDSYDNALAETVNGLYKTECIHCEGPWRDAPHVELATCSWMDRFNTNRLHSALGYQTPMEYETAHFRDNAGGHDCNGDRYDTAHEHQPWDNPASTEPGAVQRADIEPAPLMPRLMSAPVGPSPRSSP